MLAAPLQTKTDKFLLALGLSDYFRSLQESFPDNEPRVQAQMMRFTQPLTAPGKGLRQLNAV